MTTNLKNMDNAIQNLAEGKKGLTSVKKETLQEYINTVGEANKNVHGILLSLSDVSRKKLSERLATFKGDKSPSSAIQIYKSMLAGLEKQALSKEKALALDSLVHANAASAAIMSEIDKNLDSLFSNKLVNIFNTKMSHVMVLGLVQQAKQLSVWTSYLLSGITSALTKNDVPKYRGIFLTNHSSAIVGFVNDLCNKSGAYNGLVTIKQIRTANKDAKLLNDHKESNANIITSSGLKSAELDMFKKGIHSYNPFRLIGEAWNLFKHWLNDWNVQDKQWLEAHTALLKMELEGADPNDPEYLRLQKIIAVYEEKIIKLDKKINDYYES